MSSTRRAPPTGRRAPDPDEPRRHPGRARDAGPEIARNIRPDGTLPFVFDGLRVPVALPPLASAILRLIDGVRSVGAIAAALAGRGTAPDAFDRAWRQTFDALVGRQPHPPRAPPHGAGAACSTSPTS